MRNLADCLAPFVSPLGYQVLFVLELVFELCAAAFVADLISGSVHFYLDYGRIDDKELRLHVEPSTEAVIKFKENSEVYQHATLSDRFLWNTQHHHEVPYPPSDSNWEQFMQGFRPTFPFYAVSIGLWACGVMPDWIARIWIFGVTLGLLAPFTHMAAHARTRNLLKGRWGRVVCWLQDHHLIIHPETHRNHHIYFDCDFCLFNGWANPLFNMIHRMCVAAGIFPSQPPTVTTRKEIAEAAGHILEVTLGPSDGTDAPPLDKSAVALDIRPASKRSPSPTNSESSSSSHSVPAAAGKHRPFEPTILL